MVCGGCAEVIPVGGAYTPEQYLRYFGNPVPEPPAHPWGPTDEQKELWANTSAHAWRMRSPRSRA